MSIEAMKMALEALEQQIKSIEQMPIARREKGISVFAVPEAAWVGLTSCAYALRQAIEQAQKRERNFCPRCGKRLGKNDWDLHTCTPPVEQAQKQKALDRKADNARELGLDYEPQRQWVGLNWDDLPEIYVGDVAFTHGVKWAETRLKEKNCG